MAHLPAYPEVPSVTEQFHKQERNLQTRELTHQEKFASVTEAHQLVSTFAARSHLVLAYGTLWITAGILLIKFTTPVIGLFALVFLALPLIGLIQLGIYVFFRVLLRQWKAKVFIMENGSAVHRYEAASESIRSIRSGILRFSFITLPIIGLFQVVIYIFNQVLNQWKTKVFIIENGSAVHRYETIHGTRSGILRFSKSK